MRFSSSQLAIWIAVVVGSVTAFVGPQFANRPASSHLHMSIEDLEAKLIGGTQVDTPPPKKAPVPEMPKPTPKAEEPAPKPKPEPKAEKPKPAPKPKVEKPKPAPKPKAEKPKPAPKVEKPKPRPKPKTVAKKVVPAPPPPRKSRAPEGDLTTVAKGGAYQSTI